MLENIKAVIFDVDGTLMNSMHIWTDIDIEFLEKRNIKMPEMLQQEIEGLSMTETAVYFQKRFGLGESVDELITEWNAMAKEAYLHKIQMKPGAVSFIHQLRKCGIKTGIATSNSMELVTAGLMAHQIENEFDCCVTANEVAHGKPYPDVYLEAARRLHTNPKECLVFEDIIPGIMAGKNAGMKVCAIYDEYSKAVTKEKKETADYYIESYEELLK